MIVPLRFHVERKHDPSDFDVDARPRELSSPTQPTYVVTAEVFDTERNSVWSYTFHSMVDPTQPRGQEIGTIEHHGLGAGDRAYLGELHDVIGELLERAS